MLASRTVLPPIVSYVEWPDVAVDDLDVAAEVGVEELSFRL